jgi:hypothetical protein
MKGKKHKSLLSRKRKQNKTVTDVQEESDEPIMTDKSNPNAIAPTTDPLASTDLLVLTDNVELKRLVTARKAITDIIDRSKNHLADSKKKIEVFCSATKKSPESLNTIIFNILKEKGVEVTSYHSGSLTGEDIKKVMNNATYLFDTFSEILKKGQKVDCQLEDNDIDTLCAQFKAVFLVGDGAFLVARTHHPDEVDIAQYCRLVTAAVCGHENLMCSITPKFHYMWRLVEE